MFAQQIHLATVRQAAEAIDGLGSNNSEMMATRAIHINVLLTDVPGEAARFIKAHYNDLGAEAAISGRAYRGVEGVVTDVIVMGTVYQHREVRRVLWSGWPWIRPWLEAIERIVENARETVA
jgi:hypothetical protein